MVLRVDESDASRDAGAVRSLDGAAMLGGSACGEEAAAGSSLGAAMLSPGAATHGGNA